jgi:nucleotide-binding universal stress UspA family protein
MTHTSIRPTQPFRAETLATDGPVLVAVKPDGSDGAITVARWVAVRTGSQLHVLNVNDQTNDAVSLAAGIPPLGREYTLSECAELRRHLATQLPQDLQSPESCCVDVLDGPTSTTITNTARDRGARLIVVGTGRHSVLGHFLYGERALEVVRGAAGPVLVVPPTASPPFGHAVVAVDFSQASMRAAVAALDLLEPDGRLSLVHVKSAVRLDEQETGWWNDAYERRSREMLAQFADALPEPPGVRVDTALLHGDPVAVLLKFVEEHEVDLIACGRRRHSLVERILVGSVSTALVRRAAHAVLVAPERPYDSRLQDESWLTGSCMSNDSEEWPDLLRDFSKRNAGRRALLVMGTNGTDGAEGLQKGYELLAAEYDRRERRLNITVGDPGARGSQLSYKIAGLRELELRADSTGRDTKLSFVAEPGRGALTFDAA